MVIRLERRFVEDFFCLIAVSVGCVMLDDASLSTRVRSAAEDTTVPDFTITIGFTTANGLLLILFELSSVDSFPSFEDV